MTEREIARIAANLRRIRAARGLSQGDVADAAGLSRMGYRKIEAGAGLPREQTLRALASAMSVSIESLLVESRVLSKVRFRAQKRMTTREEVLANIARQLDNYAELERLLEDVKKPLLPTLRETLKAMRGDRRALEAAALVRRAFGLDEDEGIRDMCGLLEDNGVKVLTPVVASEGFFGLSVGDEDGGPAVVVNTWDRISVERWIFTAAHELGHLLLHLQAYDVEETQENEREEKEADLFAGHFLMPDSLFKKELAEAWGLSWFDRVFKLKRQFRVSYRSVLYRIANDLPDDQKRTVWIRFNVEYRARMGRALPGTVEPEGLPPDAFFRRPPDKGSDEPERLERHDFMQDRLARLVRRALERKLITIRRAAELLDVSAAEMLELVESWTD